MESSSVDFPGSSELIPPRPTLQQRPTHLPFRRISLPTPPSLQQRESVVSVASFGSLPEEGVAPGSQVPVIMRNVNAGKRPARSRVGMKRQTKQLDPAKQAKRRKILREFHETEKAYAGGLELIYSHFLTPIITSLETSQPLLDRSVLTAVFSNFIDIWNLHRSFFSSLTSTLFPNGETGAMSDAHISPVLLSHFPYLSLYTPFITAFPHTISTLTNFITPPNAYRPNPDYNSAFASFLATQEADPRCGKLKLRDWLLTIVQRCPRYLLLLKDLIESTSPDDAEHAQLTAAHHLVSKITLSLNTSLHSHAQTLSLLALQRSTPNLPFQLISPGRTLLKRGALVQVERSETPREREFLLFSDCLLWLASEESEKWAFNWTSPIMSPSAQSPPALSPQVEQLNKQLDSPERAPLGRRRSRSEAELPALGVKDKERQASPAKTRSAIPRVKRHASSSASGGQEERWVFRGKAELVDLEVVVMPGEDRKMEVMSPEGSFVLYADTEEDRDDWLNKIRQAKAQLLISLNITHPNSTLTSSSSTKHLRRALQALPFDPAESDKEISTRGKVEHWVPAIWIPDEKAEGCMRCGRSFGWRRRRHHCRLCGRCVCANCSDRTFYISDSTSKHGTTKAARACNACYETVFPVVGSGESGLEEDGAVGNDTFSSDTITSSTLAAIKNMPSWLSMPSLPTSPTPDVFMSIRAKTPSLRPQGFHSAFEDPSLLDVSTPLEEQVVQEEDEDGDVSPVEPVAKEEDHVKAAKRNKRFSFPAVALQTTSVEARSVGDAAHSYPSPSASVDSLHSGAPQRRQKRFSLVLNSASIVRNRRELSRGADQRASAVKGVAGAERDLSKGMAAGKLSELLGKRKSMSPSAPPSAWA